MGTVFNVARPCWHSRAFTVTPIRTHGSLNYSTVITRSTVTFVIGILITSAGMVINDGSVVKPPPSRTNFDHARQMVVELQVNKNSIRN